MNNFLQDSMHVWALTNAAVDSQRNDLCHTEAGLGFFMLNRASLSESREIRLRRIESATEAWKTARRYNQKENSAAIILFNLF